MENMFCFQCQQTARNQGCGISGVCGKKPATANLQDELTGALIGLARAMEGHEATDAQFGALIDGLFTTVTNVSFDDEVIRAQINAVRRLKTKLNPQCDCCSSGCGRNDDYDMKKVWSADEDTRSLKSLILFGLRGMAAYAHHARALGKTSANVERFFAKALRIVGEERSAEEYLGMALELGRVNLECMELLDTANTGAYGEPVPTRVTFAIEKGPFIVVTGHDLRDLELLLEQTEGQGVNIYTHGEMLPAHAYPELKKYSHLKGNFGTAWQNQQKEFDGIPAPILFTTNCLMPPKASYADRVYTTGVVGYPDTRHIGDEKDFSGLIARAKELGGYAEPRDMRGINGGDHTTTGFGRNAVLSVAGQVVDAVKSGAIKRFFLLGGCDGAAAGRNYYTEFVKRTPSDSVILTLACGKFRFNDLDLGTVGGLPRLLDMGQCNDAYGAIRVAAALAEAFGCGLNDLPLAMVLSWYEQKAVCILLTLLALGIRNIYLGPTLPAFLSPNVIGILVERFAIRPTSAPEEDLKAILGE